MAGGLEEEIDDAASDRRRGVETDFAAEDEGHFDEEDIAQDATGDSGDNAEQDADGRGHGEDEAFIDTQHDEEGEGDGVSNLEETLRHTEVSGDKESGEGGDDGIEHQGRAAEPCDRGIADQKVADGPASKRGGKGQRQSAKEVDAFSLGGEDARDGAHRDTGVFKEGLDVSGRHEGE